MNIEAEVRAFISKKEYENLLSFFQENAVFKKDDYQETFYFDTKEDVRIQRNNHYAKIWLKKGKLHDPHREEIEVRFSREEFEKLEDLFTTLGYETNIKWFRKRVIYQWGEITVCLDFTKGYGYIIELEKMCTKEDQEETYAYLRKKLAELDIEETPREEFDKKYNYYKENWKYLV